MKASFKEQLKDWQKLNQPDHVQEKNARNEIPKNKKTKQERFSTFDILELMGINRDRYVRKRGALRRK